MQKMQWCLMDNSTSNRVEPSTSVTRLEMGSHLFYYDFLFTAHWGQNMNKDIDVTIDKSPTLTWETSHPVSPGLQSQLEWRRQPEFKLKSHSDDNETVLGRSILVQINSLIHLIRPFWSMTHYSEYIQVIRLELLPCTGNAPLGCKSTH